MSDKYLDKSFTIAAVKVRIIEYKNGANRAFERGDDVEGEQYWAKWNAMNRMYEELVQGIYDAK